jgi:hypothetical protein
MTTQNENPEVDPLERLVDLRRSGLLGHDAPAEITLLRNFNVTLGGFAITCLLLSLIWHTSLWSIGLFLLSIVFDFVLPATIPSAKVYDAARVLNMQSYVRQQIVGGVRNEVIRLVVLGAGIFFSSPELLASFTFVLALIIVNLFFSILKYRINAVARVWGLFQLIELGIGTFVLFQVLVQLNQQSLFPKLLVILVVSLMFYFILEASTEATRRAAYQASSQGTGIGTTSIGALLRYRLYPPLLFWILWNAVPQF